MVRFAGWYAMMLHLYLTLRPFSLSSGLAAENNRCTRDEFAKHVLKHSKKSIRHELAAGMLSNHYNMNRKDDTKIGQRAMTPIGG